MQCYCLCRMLLICALMSVVAACGGDGSKLSNSTGSSRGTNGGKAMLSSVAEPPGQNCIHGGSRINRGVDSNGNHVLEVEEITGTQYVCNDDNSPINSLVETRAEPAGTNCPTGGQQFTAGLDSNSNGVLDASEIGSSGYICNGEQGGSGASALTALVAEPAGANCPNGGVRISSGADTNGSGVLDGAEATSTEYVCGGASGTNTLIHTDNEPAGFNCNYGGTRISAGLDANNNSILDPSEIGATAYACNGAPGSAIVWSDVTGTAVQAIGNGGYLANNSASEVVVTLPAAPLLGELVQVSGIGAGGWRIAQNAGQFIVTRHLAGEVAVAWTARESARMWQALASSADGLKLLAADAAGQLYTSIDGGVNWTARESIRSWNAVASSADGQRLVAAELGGQLYTSDDAGVTWTAREFNRDWSAVASSADGQRLVAAVSNGQLYTSNNGGLNWVARNGNRVWFAVSSSADGQRLIAAVFGGQLYTSNDAGVSWTARASNRDWTAVAISADGLRLLASEFQGQLHTSGDAGVTWTARDVSRGWLAVTSSANGQRLLAAEIGGQLYTSNNAGVSWIARELQRSWCAVASSADGTKLLAAVANGQLHTSVPMPRESTTVGVAGSVNGRQYDAITLQYSGAGRFVVLNFVGGLVVE